MTNDGNNGFDFSALGVYTSLEKIIKPYAQRIKERREIMEAAERKRAAPGNYLKMIKRIAPHNPEDWRAGDVCFLEQYQNDKEIYQKLLQIRKEYFNGQQH